MTSITDPLTSAFERIQSVMSAEAKEIQAMHYADQARIAVLEKEVARLREAMAAYANPFNWQKDDSGIRRVWLEPDSSTPDAYNGFEIACSAIAL